MDPPSPIRWRLADDDGGRPDLLGDLVARVPGRGELVGLELLHVNAKRVVNRVPPVSRMPFRWTINAYRGCSHACAYCFARPTHEYLGMDSGRDFERRIVVKVNAPERVRAEIASPRWRGEHIAMGTNTDPYQTCEGRYRLTRGIVEVLAEGANPFSILTKSTLVLRDIDVLRHAAARTEVMVNLSIPTVDREVWRLTEPGTPNPLRRVDAVARLNDAGIPCGVLVAPVLPGISDGEDQLRATVRACVEAGAASITTILLHLRPGVREHYLGWLAEHRPELVDDHLARYRRAYAPRQEQERHAARVRRLVTEFRGRSTTPRRSRFHADPTAFVRPGPAAAGARPGTQLSLGI
ncbi:MAG TPA: radical SAM protein [Miltoncostaeaceae bacterium]|nr:radical SAM protein [Miltoncostaeaceae bacterium]